jgi:GT2 family glycosyltransferase
VAQIHPQEGYVVFPFGVHSRSASEIQAIDGLFFAARRSVVEKVGFDAATFDGFHHYDLDFSFAAHLAGFRLGIVNDIPILHASWGGQNEDWKRYAARFTGKYAGRLHPMAPRPFSYSWVHVRTRAEMIEVMTAGCVDCTHCTDPG